MLGGVNYVKPWKRPLTVFLKRNKTLIFQYMYKRIRFPNTYPADYKQCEFAFIFAIGTHPQIISAVITS